jgi:type II secretory pathway pseudopilin PulG
MVSGSDVARGGECLRGSRSEYPLEVGDHSDWSRYFSGCGLWLLIAAASVMPFPLEAVAGPFVFGLDNRPRAPIGPIDPLGLGNSAEDPFGFVLNPTLTGPSPSLGLTLSDADILFAGNNAPQVNTLRPLGTNYVDSISTNQAANHLYQLRLLFSVDRASSGVPPSAVRDQFDRHQHPGDIFISDRVFVPPGQFLGSTVGFGWFGVLPSGGSVGSNRLLLNQSVLKLTAGAGAGNFVDSAVTAPVIGPGTHDNVDAFDLVPPNADPTVDLIADRDVYFSVNPDQPVLNPGEYASAADIYRTGPNSQDPTLFAQALLMGLAGGDDVDALVVFDRDVVGELNPQVDYALFSLSPGSESLRRSPDLPQITAADIFFTDFRGSFATFATDADIGLFGTINPAELPISGAAAGSSAGAGGTDNADSAAIVAWGDMEWDGDIDLDDVDDFVEGLTREEEYVDNLDICLPLLPAEACHLGPAADVGDFTNDGFLDFDDIPPFRMLFGLSAGASLNLSVPEPAMVRLAAVALVWLLSGRLVCHCLRRTDSRFLRETHCSPFDAAYRTWQAVPNSVATVSAPPRAVAHTISFVGRTAYTIIELLVVVTIISVLLALLLPAIQAAREAARSAQCSNNLKQLVLAIQAYHGSHNRFPSGSSLRKSQLQSGDSWHVYCLPYLEEQEIADRILQRRENIAPFVPIFFCPSDDAVAGEANALYDTNYGGSAGAGRDPDYVIDLEDKFCGDVYTDGIFYPLSKTDDDSITDGLTHTLAIGERTYFKHIWADGAYWMGSADERLCLLGMKNVRWPINAPPATSGYYVFDRDAPSNDVRTLRLNDLYFGSRHPQGAWFAFAGGNVHFLADDIAFTVYQDLATRNGGESMSSADWQ